MGVKNYGLGATSVTYTCFVICAIAVSIPYSILWYVTSGTWNMPDKFESLQDSLIDLNFVAGELQGAARKV